MILRKPYAFLIKHFKAIHAILAVLTIYLMVTTIRIYQFLSNYAQSGRFDYTNNLAGEHINFFMYLSIILILAISITIYFLMKAKEKKTKLYIATIAYYIFLFIMLSVAYGILQTIQIEVVDTQSIRAYRDIALIIYIPQLFFVIYSVIRALGFNVKSFNFQKDLEDIKAEEEDREEVEINVPKDTYKVERKIRRFIREAIYYIKENLIMVSAVLVITIIIIGTLLYFNREVYNKEYSINKTFTYKTFNITAQKATITNLSSNGTILLEGKYYLVVNLKTTNKGKAAPLEMKHFRLIIGGKNYYPTFTKNEYFTDLGIPYSGEKIKRSDTKEYILIYEIPEEKLNKNFHIRVADKVTYKVGAIIPSYKDLKLKPTKVNKKVNKGSYVLNNEINFKGSNINKTILTISNYTITNNYRYTYEYCYKEKCTQSYNSVMADNIGSINKTLLVLNYDLLLADSYFKTNSLADRYLFTTFMKIKYIVDDKTKIVSIQDKSPVSFTNVYVAQINNDIEKATNIELILSIRDYEYIIKLK